MNLSEADKDKKCWCNDSAIEFPGDLLNKVPTEMRRKACICKECVIGYQANTGVNIYEP